MLRRFSSSIPATRVGSAAAAVVATTTTTAVTTTSARNHYNWHIWSNPVRQPQLTPEQRAAVKVDTSKFPAEFADYDETDPYRFHKLWIDEMHTWSYFWLGAELAFVFTFYDMVFCKSI